jgi:hypothetical protein
VSHGFSRMLPLCTQPGSPHEYPEAAFPQLSDIHERWPHLACKISRFIGMWFFSCGDILRVWCMQIAHRILKHWRPTSAVQSAIFPRICWVDVCRTYSGGAKSICTRMEDIWVILYSENKMANTQFQDFMYVILYIYILKSLNIYYHPFPCRILYNGISQIHDCKGLG